MVCFHPIQAYRSRFGGALVFDRNIGYSDLPVTVPCGQCVGCRLERSRQWAVRCTHEASLYEENCFITLTYNDNKVPDDHSLNKRHFQLFMKRLRKNTGRKIRYYHCGEYGDKKGRPHYHACLFNYDFPDKKHWKTINEVPLYISDQLEETWKNGFCTIGSVTFESAAYVARYIMKKITGEIADDHYFDPETGVFLEPEYTTMSRRPGIGQGWIKKWTSDVYPCDNVVINAKLTRPPKYYDTQYEILDPDEFTKIKALRSKKAKKHIDNNTPLRLKTRERIQQLKLKQLPRELNQ